MIGLALLGLPGAIWPELLLGVFIHDPETMDVARFPMRLVGIGMAIEGLGMVMMHALLGAGDTRRVMAVAVLSQWGAFLPIAYLAGPMLGFGLAVIWTHAGRLPRRDGRGVHVVLGPRRVDPDQSVAWHLVASWVGPKQVSETERKYTPEAPIFRP
jgi:hypothetical protein